MTPYLFLTTVLIWGSTWMALKLQLGVVPIPWSIVWRFALAAALLMAWLRMTGKLRRPPRATWALIAMQGLCLFCLNFICFLHASRFIPSGLVAVVFSTATLWNALGARLLFGRRLRTPIVVGGILGLTGLTAMLWPEIRAHGASTSAAQGLALATLGTMLFSMGNLLSARLQAMGQPPEQTNAWGMAWGAAALAIGCLAAGVPARFDWSGVYVATWLYLAIAGSVIGFTIYLKLVGRLGPERAAYCTVLFPLVALAISSLFEGYQWSLPAILGLGLVLAGNVLVFRPPRRTAGRP
ncbi:DMT family transporter [Corticibacter populi]|uniref:DMT family transporter n=1 Tax=Corticibacter populi TaxID=1550736 RepID=A0A3M6QZC3_9BURK|nr:DMT family transporter [Corticibacter populi]RMX08384.1 DMT family transporter [Corticibacter populi]RZS35686.1 threonine/homoserine efflux transporter RhtA [Corticibacter populi]